MTILTLNKRQLQILDFIKKEIRSKGYPPSVREIGEAVGLNSSSTVHGHLSQLESKGFLRRNPAKPRAIEVLQDDQFNHNKEIVSVPIIGKVTAGLPILATENIEDTFPLPLDYLPSRNQDLFILTVQGDSMVDAGILDGDLVIVAKQNVAKNGEIVVALIEDEATVKTFYKEQGYYRLQPENKFLEPIIVKELTILGKVVGLYRTL